MIDAKADGWLGFELPKIQRAFSVEGGKAV
jgi:hypothetical protein